MNGPLHGHVALVTGSTRGIGRAVAERFAAEGARVVVNGRSAADAEQVAATLVGAVGIACDVSDLVSVRALCARVQEELGTVDILVNNAGIASRRAITRMTDDEWFESLAVNLTGSMYTTRELVPGMKAQGWGRIVNVTSAAGTPWHPRLLGLRRGQGRSRRPRAHAGVGARGLRHPGQRAVAGRAHRHAPPAPARAARPVGRRPASRPSRTAPRPRCASWSTTRRLARSCTSGETRPSELHRSRPRRPPWIASTT